MRFVRLINNSLLIKTENLYLKESLAQTNEVEELELKIRALMPERSILEILCNVEHWLNWTRHFGLFSEANQNIRSC